MLFRKRKQKDAGITTTRVHSLKKGDVVNIGGVEWHVVEVTGATQGNLRRRRWYHRWLSTARVWLHTAVNEIAKAIGRVFRF